MGNLTSAAISKRSKDLLRVTRLTAHPERNKNCKEPTQVQNQYNPFYERQLVCQKRIEQLAEGYGSNDKQREMPALGHVVWIVQDDEPLDLLGTEERNGRVAYLPAEDAQPTDGVGEELLAGCWGEFADPVVLTACCGGPGKKVEKEFRGRGGEVEKYMDAISAMDTMAARKPKKVPMYIQIKPPVPPFIRPNTFALYRYISFRRLVHCLQGAKKDQRGTS